MTQKRTSTQAQRRIKTAAYKRGRQGEQVWTLDHKPVHVIMSRYADTLRIVGSNALDGLGTGYLRVGIALTVGETQVLFRELGQALGYEMPHISEKWMSHRVGAHICDGGKNIYWHVDFGEFPKNRNVGAIYIITTRAKALRIFRALADPLGWELCEHEVTA